jgi:hypothetical protein
MVVEPPRPRNVAEVLDLGRVRPKHPGQHHFRDAVCGVAEQPLLQRQCGGFFPVQLTGAKCRFKRIAVVVPRIEYDPNVFSSVAISSPRQRLHEVHPDDLVRHFRLPPWDRSPAVVESEGYSPSDTFNSTGTVGCHASWDPLLRSAGGRPSARLEFSSAPRFANR